MSDFLGPNENSNLFQDLRWCQVIALLGVLRDSRLHDEQHIERRFREQATFYSQTAKYLGDIGLITRANQQITCNKPLPDDQLASTALVMEMFWGTENQYRAEVFRFLQRFEISAGEVICRMDPVTRMRYSATRNFLMDLGIIAHRADGDYYIVEPASITIYAQACLARSNCAPARIAASSLDRENFGNEVEKAVVAFERERVGPALACRVEHVARRNAAAGYDILSVSNAPSGFIPRYIEVKAVSNRSFQFFWTDNEINVASVLGSLYYLYLVPVGPGGEAMMNNLVMIGDPNSTVLKGDDWIVEAHVRLCRPRVVSVVTFEGTV